jgi:hypothetical protein
MNRLQAIKWPSRFMLRVICGSRDEKGQKLHWIVKARFVHRKRQIVGLLRELLTGN